jgi:hypothetical protein
LRAQLRALAAEIVPGGAPRARPPDAATSKALRTFLEAADAPARWPGTTGALDRAAGGLLVLVRDVLRAHDGTAPVATEYGVTLRTALLLRADYCAATPAGAFQDLIEWAARGLTGADADPATAATLLGVALALQAALDRGLEGRPFEPRSALVSGLSLCLLLRTSDLGLAGIIETPWAHLKGRAKTARCGCARPHRARPTTAPGCGLGHA